MQIDLERKLIEQFFKKEKRERYLGFIAKEKTRKKLLNELHYLKDLDWSLFEEIQGNQNEEEVILKRINSYKNITSCYVISADAAFDMKTFSVPEAIKQVVGTEDTLLIFGAAEVIYYEGEAFGNRYISL